MAGIVFRTVNRIIATKTCSSMVAVRSNIWFTPVLSLKTSAPLRAEPKKKKKVDPRRDLVIKDRLKKRLKRMEKVVPELIPIEDFEPTAKGFDENRTRDLPELPFEESERRALLLKKWCQYKLKQHKKEMFNIKEVLDAQSQALEELKLESEELYKAALSPDMEIFPVAIQGPSYNPPIKNYEAPEGKYNDITKVYTQS